METNDKKNNMQLQELAE